MAKPPFPLYRKASGIDSANDVSTLKGSFFSELIDQESPGADIAVFVAKNDGEARSFMNGLKLSPDGDVTTSWVEIEDGQSVVIVVFDDSSDERLVWLNSDDSII